MCLISCALVAVLPVVLAESRAVDPSGAVIGSAGPRASNVDILQVNPPVDNLCGDLLNVALFGTPGGSGGGQEQFGYGPSEMNDLQSCNYYWPEGPTSLFNASIQYNWPTTRSLDRFVIITEFACGLNRRCGSPIGRGIVSGTVQYWDGNDWVTDGYITNNSAISIEYDFVTSPLVTDAIRVTDLVNQPCGQDISPVIMEWSVCEEWYFSDGELDWHDAQEACQAIGRNLVRIDSFEAVNAAQAARLAKNPTADRYWIGLNDLTVEGVYRWVDDNSVTSFTNWLPYEPNDLASNGMSEDCVSAVYNQLGRWNDATCSTEHYFICGTKTVAKREDYVYFDNARTWHDAQAMCESIGRNLARINSAFTVDLVNDIVLAEDPATDRYWFGLNDIDNEGTYLWTDDDTHAHFFNWDNHGGFTQPNDINGDKDCVFAFAHDIANEQDAGDWGDETCDTALPFICS